MATIIMTIRNKQKIRCDPTPQLSEHFWGAFSVQINKLPSLQQADILEIFGSDNVPRLAWVFSSSGRRLVLPLQFRGLLYFLQRNSKGLQGLGYRNSPKAMDFAVPKEKKGRRRGNQVQEIQGANPQRRNEKSMPYSLLVSCCRGDIYSYEPLLTSETTPFPLLLLIRSNPAYIIVVSWWRMPTMFSKALEEAAGSSPPPESLLICNCWGSCSSLNRKSLAQSSLDISSSLWRTGVFRDSIQFNSN